MLTENAFFEMMKIVERSGMPLAIRLEVVHIISYLAHQAKADHDRRDRPEAIKKQWLTLEPYCEKHGVLKLLKAKPEVWTAISDFVGQPFKNVASSVPGDQIALNFFQSLRGKLEQMKIDSESDFRTLEKGLGLIQSQASEPKYRRDRNAIKRTWLEIHPILKKWHLIDEFQGDRGIQQKIKFFISGTF